MFNQFKLQLTEKMTSVLPNVEKDTCSGNKVNIFSNLSDCFVGYTSVISRHSCLTVYIVFNDVIRKVSQWLSSKLTWVPTFLVGQAFKTWPLPSKSTTSYLRSSANSEPNMSVATPMIFPFFNLKPFLFILMMNNVKNPSLALNTVFETKHYHKV